MSDYCKVLLHVSDDKLEGLLELLPKVWDAIYLEKNPDTTSPFNYSLVIGELTLGESWRKLQVIKKYLDVPLYVEYGLI